MHFSEKKCAFNLKKRQKFFEIIQISTGREVKLRLSSEDKQKEPFLAEETIPGVKNNAVNWVATIGGTK